MYNSLQLSTIDMVVLLGVYWIWFCFLLFVISWLVRLFDSCDLPPISDHFPMLNDTAIFNAMSKLGRARTIRR